MAGLWLCSLALTPLIAFAIVLRGGSAAAHSAKRSADPQRRRERSEVQRAAPTVSSASAPATRSVLFLGYKLGGDDLLPTRRGRVALPLPRLAHHLLVAGATGSGKTETVLRSPTRSPATSDWTIVYIDGKGDRADARSASPR